MLMLNIFDAIWRQGVAIFKDAKDIFIDTFSTFHRFLNRYFDDDFLLIMGIAFGALAIVTVFRALINHD